MRSKRLPLDTHDLLLEQRTRSKRLPNLGKLCTHDLMTFVKPAGTDGKWFVYSVFTSQLIVL